MAEQMRPASKEQAPDPSRSYERARPDDEAGMGRMDNNSKATPSKTPDKVEQAVENKQAPRQVNAQDVVNEREEAPADVKDRRKKRHPRTEGKGGTSQ